MNTIWKLNLAGNLDYIPQEALENLEWYNTFWDDMEKLEKVIKFDKSTGEGNTKSNVQINQDQNIDTNLPNDETKTFKGERSLQPL